MTSRLLWIHAAFLCAAPMLVHAADAKPTQRTVKVQKSSISREQEIELGKQAAAEVEKSMEVLHNAEIESWLNGIGQRLARTPQANAYPYYFKLLNDDSINAFALPGGPMFVHTGLIKAAENEAQVAGVLAHEMSHVALRHGVSQMGKAQTWQTILGVASGVMGGGLLGSAVNAGGSLGVGSLLGKYSRDAERDADLNGARMAAEAGYQPLEMARFFEKLEAEMGSAARPRGIEAWLASHPDPGRRVQYVSEDIRFYAAKDYTADSGKFERIKTLVNELPPPRMRPAEALQPVRTAPRPDLPAGFVDLTMKDFSVAYPRNWQAGQAQAGGSVYVVPQGGIRRGRTGQDVELILGATFNYFQSETNADLSKATAALLASLRQSDTSMQAEPSTPVPVGGKAGMITRIRTRTSYASDPEQVVRIYTVVRPAGLWMMAVAAPASRQAEADPLFRQMLESVRFND